MIPEYPIVSSMPIDESTLLAISAQEWQDGGWDPNLYYSPVDRYEWVEAIKVLAFERSAISEAAQATTSEGFYTRLAASSHSPDWDEPFDFGVAGLVLALTAAGFRTSNSCSGHYERGMPFVRMVTDASHLELLYQACTKVGCSAIPAEGQVEVHGQTVLHLVSLGDELARCKDAFESVGFVELEGEWVDE